jgi:hypothetical protein
VNGYSFLKLAGQEISMLPHSRISKRGMHVAMSLAFCFGATVAPAAFAQTTQQHEWVVEMREDEHKTTRHPTKKFYASIWPDGIQVSFAKGEDSFPSYTFPAKDFVLGEATYLLSPAMPSLLPMRVTRIAENDFRLEWLKESPAADGTKIVESWRPKPGWYDE